MRYPVGHREETRRRILRSALILFRRHGFDGVSIDQVMAGANLTRGGFYGHFRTKSELYAEVLAMARSDFSIEDAAKDPDEIGNHRALRIIQAYLSDRSADAARVCSPIVPMPSEISARDSTVKQAFEDGIRLVVEIVGRDLDRRGVGDPARPLAIAGMCIGTMMVARCLPGEELATELRSAVMNVAVRLCEASGAGQTRESESAPRPPRRHG
jgi:AcrR family transcriptional regulator